MVVLMMTMMAETISPTRIRSLGSGRVGRGLNYRLSPIRSSLLFILILLLQKSSSLSTSNSVALNVPSASYSAVYQKKVVIVGGGPVGLATALTLSYPPHSCHVTVLERTTGETAVSTYDPSRPTCTISIPADLHGLIGSM
jgi:hypothetical protein